MLNNCSARRFPWGHISPTLTEKEEAMRDFEGKVTDKLSGTGWGKDRIKHRAQRKDKNIYNVLFHSSVSTGSQRPPIRVKRGDPVSLLGDTVTLMEEGKKTNGVWGISLEQNDETFIV